MNNQFDEKTEDAFKRVFGGLPVNQCDGCKAGMYKTEIGTHLDFSGKPVMVCQEHKYLGKGE